MQSSQEETGGEEAKLPEGASVAKGAAQRGNPVQKCGPCDALLPTHPVRTITMYSSTIFIILFFKRI